MRTPDAEASMSSVQTVMRNLVSLTFVLVLFLMAVLWFGWSFVSVLLWG